MPSSYKTHEVVSIRNYWTNFD